MLNKLKELHANHSEEGFTLIELMVVVVIIGILAAVAIPIFMNQQKAALQAGLKQDVRNLQLLVTTYLVKNPTATNLQWRFIGGSQLPGKALNDDAYWLKLVEKYDTSDPGNIMVVRQDRAYEDEVAGTWQRYVVLGANPKFSPNGSNYYFYYDSSTGKITEQNA